MAESQSIGTKLIFDGVATFSSFDGHPDIEMAGLREVDDKKTCWSPPHAFISSVESCFWLTLLALAEKMRIKIKRFSSSAEGVLESSDEKHKEFTKITIRPSIEFENVGDEKKMAMLYEKAHEYCLVARSIKTTIEVIPQ